MLLNFTLFMMIFLTNTVFARVSILEISNVEGLWNGLQWIDARSLAEHKRGKIPGAVHMDWREFLEGHSSLTDKFFGSKKGKVLTDEKLISEKLSKLGIRDDLPIVVYGENGPWGEEGRIAWNLLFWGAKDVRLLNGGWQSWKGKNLFKLFAVKQVQKKFNVQLDFSRRISFEQIKQLSLANEIFYDVRSLKEYQGTPGHGLKRGGKINHASHFDDAFLYTKTGFYPDATQLSELLKNESKISFVYCTGGVRSALLAFLIEARLGYKVANYDGSMWEWESKTLVP